MKKDMWNEFGDIYLKANATEAAIDSYQKSIQLGCQNSEVFINLAGAYMRQGHIVESIQIYKKGIDLLETTNEKAVIYTKIGECYRLLQDYEQAIEAFRTAIDLDPGNPRLIDGLVDVQRDLEKLYSLEAFDFHKSEEDLSVTCHTPEEDEVTAAACEPLVQVEIQGEVEEDSLPTQVLNERVSNDCADILPPMPVMEDRESMTADNADALSSDPVEEMTSVSVEEAEQKQENLNNDTDSLREGFQFSSQEILPLENNLEKSKADGKEGIGSSKIERPDEVESALEKEEGVRVTMLLTLGIMYWRNESLEEAHRILQTAIEGAVKINNTWIEALAWHALALVKTALADIVGAIGAYLRAVELAPEQIFPWNNVGTLYISLGKQDEALNSFRKAISQNPEDSISWNGMGDIFTRLGRLDDAIAAYQLGNVFDMHSRSDDAIKSYEKAFYFYKFTLSSLETESSFDKDNSTNESEMADDGQLTLPDQGSNESSGSEQINSDQLIPSLQTDSDENFLQKTPELIPLNAGPVPLVVDENSATARGLMDVQEPGELEQKNAGGQTLPILVPDEIRARFSHTPVSKPGEGIKASPALRARDKRSIQVVDLYEKFMGETNSGDKKLRSQVDNRDEIFSADPVSEMPLLSETDLPFMESPVSEPDEIEKQSDQALETLPLSDETLMETTNPAEIGLTAEEDPGSTPEVGMLPIVDTEPAPRPEVNRVAVTIATYEATVRENPYNDRAWDSLGNLYRIVQRNKDAIRAFERAVALEPTKYVYHYQLGTLYASEGNFAQAIQEIQTVVDLNPEFTFAHCALANYLRRIGQDDEAQRHIAIAAPFMQNEKEYDRACFESIRGNVDGALELLESALEKKQTTVEWIKRDLDLDFIRQDPRYSLLTNKSSQSVIGY